MYVEVCGSTRNLRKTPSSLFISLSKRQRSGTRPSFARGLGTMVFVEREGMNYYTQGSWVWTFEADAWESKGMGARRAKEAGEQGTR